MVNLESVQVLKTTGMLQFVKRARLACTDMIVSNFQQFGNPDRIFLCALVTDMRNEYMRACWPLNETLPNCYNETFHEVSFTNDLQVYPNSCFQFFAVPFSILFLHRRQLQQR